MACCPDPNLSPESGANRFNSGMFTWTIACIPTRCFEIMLVGNNIWEPAAVSVHHLQNINPAWIRVKNPEYPQLNYMGKLSFSNGCFTGKFLSDYPALRKIKSIPDLRFTTYASLICTFITTHLLSPGLIRTINYIIIHYKCSNVTFCKWGISRGRRIYNRSQ